MDKLKMQSNNLVDANVEKIAKLFPNCVTEAKEDGKLIKKVDFDLFRQELSSVLVEGKDERYRLDWAGKRQAILTANSPIAKTLRPCREESVNFDKTENLYIEGDNLDVLKLLHETYLSKVKMIYIDPPYNTGNDFVYEDDFAIDSEEYLAMSNQKDDQGNRMSTNKETSGRFHSDWLSMMYMRLKLARDLLTDDGVIFISIDDNEQANLKKICDEIFGARNFLLTICVNRTSEIATNYTVYKHEYVLVYVKDADNFNLRTIEKYSVSRGTVGNADQTMPIMEFPAGISCHGIPDGKYDTTRKLEGSSENIENFDPIIVENGKLKFPVKLKARWRSSNDMRNFFANDCKPTPAKINGDVVEIYFENDRFNPQIKKKTYEKIPSMYLDNKRGSEDIKKLNMEGCFDFPKSVSFIKFVLSYCPKDAIVMDFFSGSGTTAQAVLEQNIVDKGNRKFILIQLPENLDENYAKAIGSSKETMRKAINICDEINKPHILSEVSKERIRRASKKIAEENRMTAPNLDIGFRVLKIADSNMKDVYYNPKQYNQSMLLGLDSSIKEDRSAEDILFQVMLDKGVSLSSKIEKKTTANGKQTFYIVGETGFGIIDLICCLDKQVNTDAVKEIAKLQPECCVFLDSGIENDATRTNIQQIFDTYSPKTKVEVL